MDSVFPAAGSPHFFSEHLGEGLAVQRVEDVTGFFAEKVAALAEHASQLSEGIRFFEEFLEKEAVEAGSKVGAERAEEFRVLDLS